MLAAQPATVSVVTSLYRSAPFIYEFFMRTRAAIESQSLQYEFIFVDDGSPDDSAEKVLELRQTDERVHLIKLSRNHGQQRAIMAGLRLARGDYVFVIDVDLEERPEDFVTLFQTLTEWHLDAAYGVMNRREGTFVRRFLGGIFHRLMTKLSSIPIPKDQLWSRVMTRRYTNAVCSFSEDHLYLGGCFSWSVLNSVL